MIARHMGGMHPHGESRKKQAYDVSASSLLAPAVIGARSRHEHACQARGSASEPVSRAMTGKNTTLLSAMALVAYGVWGFGWSRRGELNVWAWGLKSKYTQDAFQMQPFCEGCSVSSGSDRGYLQIYLKSPGILVLRNVDPAYYVHHDPHPLFLNGHGANLVSYKTKMSSLELRYQSTGPDRSPVFLRRSARGA